LFVYGLLPGRQADFGKVKQENCYLSVAFSVSGFMSLDEASADENQTELPPWISLSGHFCMCKFNNFSSPVEEI